MRVDLDKLATPRRRRAYCSLVRPLIQRQGMWAAAVAAGVGLAALAWVFAVMVDTFAILVVLGGIGDRAPAPPPLTSFVIRDGRLLDANAHDFVMRGVSHMHTTDPDQTAGALAAMKRLGANTVRIELSTGVMFKRNEAADVANVISLCRRNLLVCVLEVADTTGFGNRPKAITQAQAVDYWISIQNVLTGQEKYVILDVANEPYVFDNSGRWPTETAAAIGRLRAAGFRHTLMVGAPDWGQDWSFTMRDNAAAIFNQDPERNLIFSIHMYGAFITAAKVRDYLDWYVNAALPIVIGEFSHLHSDGDPDEDTMMSVAKAHGLGYLAWSWSGNRGDLNYLDMVRDFNPDEMTWWGNRIFDGPDGIGSTAREATIYG
jgi:mannan endo-1,4-beta-mannosidase